MVTLTNGWSVDAAHVLEALRDADMQAARLIYEGPNDSFLSTLRPPPPRGVPMGHPGAGQVTRTASPVATSKVRAALPLGTAISR